MKKLIVVLLVMVGSMNAITDAPGISYQETVAKDWFFPLTLSSEVKNQKHFKSCTYYPGKNILSCEYTPAYAKEKGQKAGFVKQRQVMHSETQPVGNVKIYGTFTQKQLMANGKYRTVTYYVYRTK